MSNAYLICRPPLGYEESLDPLMVAISKEAAERDAGIMRDWCAKRALRLGRCPELDDEKGWERWDKENEKLSRSRPPFGLAELKAIAAADFNHMLGELEQGAISVIELPLSEPPNDTD